MTYPDQCPNCKARLPRRADFLPPSYGRESIFGVTAFVAGYAAAFFVLFHLSWPADLWPWRLGQMGAKLVTGAVFYGAWVAIIGVGSTTVYWLAERNQRPGPRPPRYDSEADEFAATARNTLRRLPRGVSELRLWQYLIGIARDREGVTLSQRGASEYGFSQAQANDIKDWCCEVGWYEVINGANGYGQWTAEGERVLAMLAQHPPALWGEVVAPPTADDAYPPERAVLDQHARSSTAHNARVGELYDLAPWGDDDD